MSLTLGVVSQILAVVPDPGQGTAPPGSDKLLTILKWVSYVAIMVCVGGVIITGARMAIAHRRGSDGEAASSLAWVMGGCILIGSASGMVTVLL
jgi:hypothetical protein